MTSPLNPEPPFSLPIGGEARRSADAALNRSLDRPRSVDVLTGKLNPGRRPIEGVE
jgi:hypothetical protein